ncbi:MAG TPA: twin-arginine translocase subunit TatC, partial [bacterium]|nr:twin-arginine translocase subunit TatC [bacterium]
MEEKDLSIVEHLEELRRKIIYSSIFFIFSSFISYFFSNKLLLFIVKPLKKYQETIVFLKPVEPFFSILKITFFTAGVISLTFILLQIYLFIAPGLTEKE